MAGLGDLDEHVEHTLERAELPVLERGGELIDAPALMLQAAHARVLKLFDRVTELRATDVPTLLVRDETLSFSLSSSGDYAVDVTWEPSTLVGKSDSGSPTGAADKPSMVPCTKITLKPRRTKPDPTIKC